MNKYFLRLFPLLILVVSCSSNTKAFEPVDLGLSVKWASANLGATAPEERGQYYAWGELNEKMSYNWAEYAFCNDGDANKLTKYCPEDKPDFWDGAGTPDDLLILNREDDVANSILGGNWRIPTDEEWAELFSNCTWTGVEINGVKGYRIVSNINHNNIFLPAVGWKENNSLTFEGVWGYYWSSTINTINPNNAKCTVLNEYRNGTARGAVYRYYGLSIRPVTD